MTPFTSKKRLQVELDALPPGVTLLEWSYERTEWQNPRIRTLLGCITLISGVLESNYAILHCSPDRLDDIWKKVCKVSRLMQGKLRPLLSAESAIPTIEEERVAALAGLDMLSWSVLDGLEAADADQPTDLLELRKQLCIAIGQINGYLQDTFGRLMAADPRSLHDFDYYLSNRFPRDIEEAEWLYSTVGAFRRYTEDVIQPLRIEAFPRCIELVSHENAIDSLVSLSQLLLHLKSTSEDLVDRLREILALRGIRFAEMEALDRYTQEIPRTFTVVDALHEVLLELDETTPPAVRKAIVRRIRGGLQALDSVLLDLCSFVPLWLANIEERRALLLKQS